MALDRRNQLNCRADCRKSIVQKRLQLIAVLVSDEWEASKFALSLARGRRVSERTMPLGAGLDGRAKHAGERRPRA